MRQTCAQRGCQLLLRISSPASQIIANKPRPVFRNNVAEKLQKQNFATSAACSERLTIVVPEMAESISEGTLTSFQRKVNDIINPNDQIALVETDKIDVTIDTPEGGHIIEFLVAEGDTVVVGQKVAVIETEAAKRLTADEDKEAPAVPSHQQQDQHFFRPHMSATDREESTQPQEISPTDPQHRVSPSDQVGLDGTRRSESPKPSPVSEHGAQKPSQPAHRGQKEKILPMPRIRLTIAKRLKDSQNRTASLTAMQQVDMSALMTFRKLYKGTMLEQHGVRLGYMGAFIRAATIAALEVPEVNASMDVENAYITYRDYVDVSVAVSTPKGLVTPVLRNCESKDIITIEKGVAYFAEKARGGKLTMDDISGGNFTISNPGIFGSMFGTPVINYPQSAVFNMNSIRDEPIVINGQLVIRPVMHITITYDHRLIDGREAAQFLNTVKKNIEDPGRMLLSGGRWT